jgi:hypothetical protein
MTDKEYEEVIRDIKKKRLNAKIKKIIKTVKDNKRWSIDLEGELSDMLRDEIDKIILEELIKLGDDNKDNDT